jgi:hypothetical protein
VISVEEYQDATGTDNKESFSLEPCLSTGLLKSEFNGDHRSRFIIGYFFLNRNPQQTNVGELVHKVLDPAFAITTSVFQLATVSQGSNGPPLDVRLGIKSRVRASRNGCSSG